MQKHSRQVLRSSRLKTRLGGSVSLIVQDPDNIVKSAVRGFPSGDEHKLSWNRRDRRFNGNNVLRRIRRKCGWEDPVGHDGGMPRGDEEAACRGFRHIHGGDRKASRNTGEDVGLKDNSKQAESVEKIPPFVSSASSSSHLRIVSSSWISLNYFELQKRE